MSPPFYTALKREAICFSETPVDFQQTIRRYIPEDTSRRNHRSENLRSYKHNVVSSAVGRVFLSWLFNDAISIETM
jgi:hypothetical protein